MLYKVETKVLNQKVKRNVARFPERFRFQLTKQEMLELVTICDQLGEPVAKYDQLDGAVTKCDLKNINIENLIHIVRGQKVMLDSDLAMLYGVETRALNQAVKRNLRRFPDDFMFQFTKVEWDSLRSQIVTLEDLKSQNAIS